MLFHTHGGRAHRRIGVSYCTNQTCGRNKKKLFYVVALIVRFEKWHCILLVPTVEQWLQSEAEHHCCGFTAFQAPCIPLVNMKMFKWQPLFTGILPTFNLSTWQLNSIHLQMLLDTCPPDSKRKLNSKTWAQCFIANEMAQKCLKMASARY